MPSFGKEERLCSKKIIEQVFQKGNIVNAYPFFAKWMFLDMVSDVDIHLLVIVPKRIFKKAVERNKIKRHIREAYRNNKQEFSVTLKAINKKIALMIMYEGNTLTKYQDTEQKIVLLLQQIQRVVQ